MAYILGYSYGDGFVDIENGQLSLAMSNDWEDIKVKIKKYTKQVFNYTVFVREKEKACEDFCIYSKLIINHLKNNNILKEKAGKIVLPEFLYTAKKEIFFSFLAGIFDADGTVSTKKKAYKLSLIQGDFINNIQKILYSYGIISKIHITKRKPEHWNDMYELLVSDKISQEIFKENMIESVKVSEKIFDPKVKSNTRTTFQVKDLTKASKHSYFICDSQFVSRSSFYRLMKGFGSNRKTYEYQDSIKSIEFYNDNENQYFESYYIETKNKSPFFANGFSIPQ